MKEYDETEYWLAIQKYRRCEGCLFFDAKRKGKMVFCTFAFRLDIDEITNLCHTRKDGEEVGHLGYTSKDGDDYENQEVDRMFKENEGEPLNTSELPERF